MDDMQELARHITRIHEINYSHYAWAKDTNLEGQFPHKCCGSSAKNILLNLMDAGYPNATQFYNSFRDHAYNGVPFVFGPEKEKT